MMPNSYDVMVATIDETTPARRNAAIAYSVAWSEWEAHRGTAFAPVAWAEVERAQARFFGLEWS